LSPGDYLLDECVGVGPVDRRADPDHDDHEIDGAQSGEVEEQERRDTTDHEPSENVQRDAQVAPVEPIDQDAAYERHDDARNRPQDEHEAHLHRRVRFSEDVPGDAGEIHP
jgi:hypothetical protein